jgi:hypothetical protein
MKSASKVALPLSSMSSLLLPQDDVLMVVGVIVVAVV